MRRDALRIFFLTVFFSSGNCGKLRIHSLRLGLGVRLGGKESIYFGKYVGGQHRLR